MAFAVHETPPRPAARKTDIVRRNAGISCSCPTPRFEGFRFLFVRVQRPNLDVAERDFTMIALQGNVPLIRLREMRHLAELALSHALDRKSTRLNSSHGYISYAV